VERSSQPDYPDAVSKPSKPKPASEIDHKAIAKLTWEQAIERLEEINDAIESGEIGLEASVTAYAEGVALREHCSRILEQAELRIVELSPDQAGTASNGSKDSGSSPRSSDEPDEPAPF